MGLDLERFLGILRVLRSPNKSYKFLGILFLCPSKAHAPGTPYRLLCLHIQHIDFSKFTGRYRIFGTLYTKLPFSRAQKYMTFINKVSDNTIYYKFSITDSNCSSKSCFAVCFNMLTSGYDTDSWMPAISVLKQKKVESSGNDKSHTKTTCFRVYQLFELADC